LTASTAATATTIVTIHSTTRRRTRVRESRRELAADQRDRVEILVREVLQHHAVEAEVFDLLELLDDLLDGSDGAALCVALEHLLWIAAEACADPPRRLVYLAVVTTDDERRHQRVAERRRVASGALARFVEALLALARIVERPEDAVVLVGERNGRAGRPRLRAAAHENRQFRPLQAWRVLQPVVLAGEVDAVLAEEFVHDLELLREAGDPLAGGREVEAVGLVLALHPAGAHAEHDASA
jgi:hypothetical protein